MPADIVTNNIAEICLATGCAALCDSPAGIMLAGPNFAVPVHDAAWEEKYGRDFGSCPLAEYLSSTDFESAARAISESVAEASLKSKEQSDCDNYYNLLWHVDKSPMLGRVVLAPIGNIWPDAMAGMIPWDKPGYGPDVKIHDRIFPIVAHIDAVALVLPEYENIQAWCIANPKLLAWDGDVCCGWNSATGRVARVNVETVDFRKPWRIIKQPDGSEIIAPAEPMILKSPMLSYYEPGLHHYARPKKA